MNKKLLGIAGALVLTAVAGVSCAKAPCPEAQTYVYFGLGNFAKASQRDSVRGNADSAKNVQTDVYGAAVLFDQDGKIIEAKIDVMQAAVKAATLTTIETSKLPAQMNAEGDFKSKWELGDAYNMLPASPLGLEWYVQMGSYQDWLVGKTLADVNGAGYKVGDPTHVFVPTHPDLIASVSITTEGYLNALTRAWDNRVKFAVDSVEGLKVGVGMVSKITNSMRGGNPVNEVGVTVAGGVFDADDKVLAARHDYHQVPLTISERDDKLDVSIRTTGSQIAYGGTAQAATILSKHDLGPAYSMYYKAVDTATAGQATFFFNGKIYEVRFPNVAGEWNEQAFALANFLLGKTVADVVAGVDTSTNSFNDGVLASVTVTVDEYLAAYTKASAVANDENR